jgi:hypothetical protein
MSVSTEPVNPGEPGRLENYCVGGTPMGLLIQTGPGNATTGSVTPCQ